MPGTSAVWPTQLCAEYRACFDRLRVGKVFDLRDARSLAPSELPPDAECREMRKTATTVELEKLRPLVNHNSEGLTSKDNACLDVGGTSSSSRHGTGKPARRSGSAPSGWTEGRASPALKASLSQLVTDPSFACRAPGCSAASPPVARDRRAAKARRPAEFGGESRMRARFSTSSRTASFLLFPVLGAILVLLGLRYRESHRLESSLATSQSVLLADVPALATGVYVPVGLWVHERVSRALKKNPPSSSHSVRSPSGRTPRSSTARSFCAYRPGSTEVPASMRTCVHLDNGPSFIYSPHIFVQQHPFSIGNLPCLSGAQPMDTPGEMVFIIKVRDGLTKTVAEKLDICGGEDDLWVRVKPHTCRHQGVPGRGFDRRRVRNYPLRVR